MSVDRNKKTASDDAARKKKDLAAEIANTFEWLITAFILAFVFRAFIMEAFRIPTGSMADTLKGAHFRLCCEQCGYRYGLGFSPERYRLKQDTIPTGSVELPHTRCPSCGYEQGYSRFTNKKMPVANGDRILVLKCIYQFIDPKRWDVIVFKNPLDPTENYIKRLIGLPGEKIEIIDGDIYINDQIRRKPPKVQNELWTIVYDNDYQPVRPEEGTFAGHPWWQPLRNDADSKWIIDDRSSPALARLADDTEQINTLIYQTPNGTDFKAVYSYNDVDPRREDDMPECSDLMARFYVEPGKSNASFGITLRKYQTSYSAWISSTNEMVIARVGPDKKLEELNRKPILPPGVNKPALFKFANVDHQLIFEFGSEKLTYDMGAAPGDAGPRKADDEPRVKIFGAGRLMLSHIAIFRDIHYTSGKTANGKDLGRATEGNPFTLANDEFFVLGDNSPNSEDGRWWSSQGVANNGLSYREGIVPRDYLVGKALFVYWPSGFDFPWPEGLRTYLSNRSHQNLLMRILNVVTSLRWIPNVGQMRFIYGGSGDSD
jgi:signal peptidase I